MEALVEGLRPEYDLPILIAETITLAAAGEAELGGMIEQDSFILFYLGAKSYSCLFFNGNVHLGALGLAPSGNPLADQLNDTGLMRIFRSASGSAQLSSARLIFEAARQHEPVARQSVATVAATLAEAMLCVANTLHIAHVVIAGPWVRSADLLIPMLEAYMQEAAGESAPQISAARLGDDAPLLGAVCRAIKMVDVTI